MFFGSGAFAVPVLEALAAAPEVLVVVVVTAPPRPSGRAAIRTPTAVGDRAAALGLPILAPARLRDPAVIDALAARQPAIGILADYGKLLPQAILDLPGHGILNLHPSLLPRHRGATPIPAAILADDPRTGVSLFRMDAGMDTGPLVASRAVTLAGDEDAPGLESRLAGVAADLLRGALVPWLRGELPAVAQPSAGASVTRPFGREDGRLDPMRPAVVLERQVRAMRPWPGTFVSVGTARIAVLRTAPTLALDGDQPGFLVDDLDSGLALATADGRLRLLEVRPAGGRPMTGAALVRGHAGLIGARVG